MKQIAKNQRLIWASLLLTGLLASCGGQDSPDGSNVSGLAADGNIERAEASALINQKSEVGEPVDINGVNLSKSETEEPFDI